MVFLFHLFIHSDMFFFNEKSCGKNTPCFVLVFHFSPLKAVKLKNGCIPIDVNL